MEGPDIKEKALELTKLVLDLYEKLSHLKAAEPITKGLLDCCASAGSHIRASAKGKSMNDYINRLRKADDQLDVAGYWLDVLDYMLKDDKDVKTLIAKVSNLQGFLSLNVKTARLKKASMESRKRRM